MRLSSAFRTLFAILSAVVLLAPGVEAQTKDRFVSVYGGFSIELPEITTLTKGFRDEESNPPSVGTVYAWDTGRVVYTVRYSIPSDVPISETAPQARLDYENEAVRQTVKRYGGTIVSEKSTDTGFTLGTTIVAKVGDGLLTAFNFIAKNDYAYSVQSIARDAKDDPAAVKVLATFTIVDGEKLIDEKIARLTPPGFPETSKRIWAPDRNAENLRGPVKTVTESKQDSEGSVPLFALRMTFDESGSQTSAVRFDRDGMPTEVEVFGFENGNRVSRTRFADPSTPEEWTLYRKRFDRQGRPFRISTFNSEGSLILKTVFERSRNSLLTYLGDESVMITTRSIVDAHGDPVITDFRSGTGERSRTITLRYRYSDRDRFGNWRKRRVFRKSEDGKWEEQSVTRRVIEYHSR